MQRSFVNILSSDVLRTADFYIDLLSMTRHFSSDWFMILTHPEIPGFEYGILQRDHEIVPKELRKVPAGMIVTFVVEDCDAIHTSALQMGATILEPPKDMTYGQRRMLVADPDGTILDISAPTSPIG